ncbi:MAG: GGDEF domain-containing protein [Hyphomicrobiales bacterium]|nr:GGDEF domain-containing protein [Hyphomicrobiales bacterium]
MGDIICSVAELTGLRDRDDLETTLARVMFDLVDAASMRLWRVVRGEPDSPKLRLRVQLPDETAEQVEARLDDHPHLQACYEAGLRRREYCSEANCFRCVFPIVNRDEIVALAEVTRAEPLGEQQERIIFGLLRIYINHIGVLDYGDSDDLTGLFNRRTFDESFRRLARTTARRAAENGERREALTPQAYLAVLDIDLFKRVNDEFGHPYGDEVLVLFARLMTHAFRDVDKLFRFGGEEFVVMLTRTDQAGAEAALERFRALVERFDFPQVGRITVSIGHTRVKPADTGFEAFGRADAALYEAKKRGRNQIRSYEALVRDGALAPREKAECEAELF